MKFPLKSLKFPLKSLKFPLKSLKFLLKSLNFPLKRTEKKLFDLNSQENQNLENGSMGGEETKLREELAAMTKKATELEVGGGGGDGDGGDGGDGDGGEETKL